MFRLLLCVVQSEGNGSDGYRSGSDPSSGPPDLSVLLLPQAIKIRVLHRK